ncbi:MULTISPECIES: TauD/TfdA family dioxygenase [Providencia]|nr:MULTISPECIES: TauD/TfdA family dioxygenase [Providencia]MTC56312.1 spore coat protein CotH [Providencia rustigianii]
MNATIKWQPMMSTGFGAKMSANDFMQADTNNIKKLLMRQGFLVINKLKFDVIAFRDMYTQFGSIVERVEQHTEAEPECRDVMQLDGKKDRLLTGRNQLPFHADGGVLLSPVDQIFLYANEIKNMKFHGATIICDQVLALKEAPPHLIKILKHETFQVRALDRGCNIDISVDGWFDMEQEGWCNYPVFTDLGWIEQMLIYFPFNDGQQANWESRIVGFSKEETKKFFAELAEFIKQPRYSYKHYWENGDLLIMDNRRVLHEREEFEDDKIIRHLYRGQTTDSSLSE